MINITTTGWNWNNEKGQIQNDWKAEYQYQNYQMKDTIANKMNEYKKINDNEKLSGFVSNQVTS